MSDARTILKRIEKQIFTDAGRFARSGEEIRRAVDVEIAVADDSARDVLRQFRSGFHDEDCAAYIFNHPYISDKCDCAAREKE